ncbi:MAG: UDP-N-acetylmuramate--L-alanine ligase [Ruminococcus sp.]|jgi:UDP-N-acetylmuramate--alanine ligase|nr:UDP-N-acetylmuramate--L-alanine ligase [Ruminococcus sp.]
MNNNEKIQRNINKVDNFTENKYHNAINFKHIHLIGIGGSGMYPLAQILKSNNFSITGSDNNETETVEAVRKMGIKVFMGQKPENIIGADLVVYSAAISKDNPERAAAENTPGLAIWERSELLGAISRMYPLTVGISGTHGKTTCTSMLTEIFHDSGADITAVIGGKLKAIGGSGISGNSDIFVVESCEFNDTFLKLSPAVSVILNIDDDHMDYFKTMDNLKASFRHFADSASTAVFINGDDENTVETVSGIEKPLISFGMTRNNTYYPKNIVKVSPFTTTFDIYKKQNNEEILITDIEMHVPGEHNILNVTAAAAIADFLGVKAPDIKQGIKNFRGAGRRFEKFGEKRGIVVCDDYAHHPTEISAVLKTATTMGFKNVWAVHQPFTFSRTKTLLNEFAEALSIADKVVLTDIFGGREVNTFDIHTEDLGKLIPGCIYYPESNKEDNFNTVADFVVKNAADGDLIITLGCGDANKLARKIVELL